jgi:O-acetyl-ADP-ribose deacetylase (regulator of RNase III)
MEKNGNKWRLYTQEFKAEAAALAEKREKTVSQIAGDLGVRETLPQTSAVKRVLFVCFDAENYRLYREALGASAPK